MSENGRNQRWRQNEETSLITDQCLVQQEVLFDSHLKDASMTQRIFSQMPNAYIAYINFILSTLLPIFGYAI